MTYDFWGAQAKKNAPARGNSPRQQSRPWWMGGRSAPAEPEQPLAPVSSAGFTPEDMAVIEASTRSAEMVRNSTGRCPRCRGGHYASLGTVTGQHGSFENRQCYDCGFPVRHDGVPGMGIAVTSSGGRTRQTDAGGRIVHNYHPQNTAAGRLA